ncbi:MAG: polysaccharide biosynthesis C-terminal domain-containing protein, partial [Bacteroidales bacterium]|nr:polysaccharide biosynthesis C-terminal domain-containing protein [Bacteroidales bacterium]
EFRFTGFGGFIDKNIRKQIISLSLFGIIAGLSGIAIANIDKYMVNHFEGLGSAGIYSIAVYFAALILIPGRALGKVAVPIIAEAWKRNDLKEINMVYSKSSINQFILGMLIFLGVLGNLDNILRILPPEYGTGGLVIILFGLANLINSSSGVSANILGTSHIYKIQTYLMIFLIALVIITNIIFIPLLGISGAALASLISMVIFTGLRVFILKRKFGFWPYNYKHLVTIILGAITYIIVYMVPQTGLIPDLIIRSLLISIIFGAGVYLLNISVEVNTKGRTIISYFKRNQ